jgi:polysaccharide biosynthesis/export protein
MKLLSILSLLLLFSGSLAAQAPGTAPSAESPQAVHGNEHWNQKINQLSFGGQGSTDYRLGPGDLIDISVFGVDDFRRQVRISSSGTVTLPFLGTLEVAGLSAIEMEEKLGKMLSDGNFIQNPQVTVFISEYRSQTVFVLGAVQRPGQYQMTHQMNLVDVIAMAGGLDLTRAGDEVTVQKRSAPTAESAAMVAPQQGAETAPVQPVSADPVVSFTAAQQQVNAVAGQGQAVKIDLKQLLEEGDMSLNLAINGGDIVQVPERQIELFYVIGEVRQPGVYELPEHQNIGVTQALAWAGGPMRTAKADKGILVRYDEHGNREELAVNLDDIMKGRKTDIAVRANDVIFVPGSTAKNIGYGLLGVIPGTVSNGVIWGTIRRR